jgi:membrane protein DedA with SNARE-associated domain
VLPGFFGEIERVVGDYGYLAVALGILLEDFGLPTPGETMLITGAILASGGALNIYLLLPLAWLGAVVGDNIGYVIGYYGGHRLMLRYGARIGITEDRLKQVERFFERYGGWVIVFARFVVVLRQFNGIVAGTLEMPWPRFFIYNAIGAALWVGCWGGATYWLGRRLFDYLRSFGWSGRLMLALAAIAAVAILAQLWWHWRARHGASPTVPAHDKSFREKS